MLVTPWLRYLPLVALLACTKRPPHMLSDSEDAVLQWNASRFLASPCYGSPRRLLTARPFLVERPIDDAVCDNEDYNHDGYFRCRVSSDHATHFFECQAPARSACRLGHKECISYSGIVDCS